MKKNDFAGWQEVFRFAFVQGIKQKSYYLFLIIFALIIIGFQPVKSFIREMKAGKEVGTTIETVYVYDESGMGIDYSDCLPGEEYEGVTIITNPGDTYEEHVKLLEEQNDCSDVLVRVSYEQEGYFRLAFLRASKSPVKKADCEKAQLSFGEFFSEAKLQAIEVSEEQYAFISQPVETEVQNAGEDGELVTETDNSISLEEYMVILFGVTLVLLLINMCGGSIAMSIVTEKSTRVVEYLMINVRPMALIVGKLLSSVALVMIQFAVMGVAYFMSATIDHAIFGNPVKVETLSDAGVDLSKMMDLFSGVNPLSVVIFLITIVLGILFFGMIAGLAGASVSKMEELAEGLKVYQFTMIGGSYIGIFLCIAQMMGNVPPMIVNLCCIFPISAPFVMPIHLLLGKINLVVALISLLILALLTAALFVFTARVYESMIFYNGKVLKLKDIVNIAKDRRPERKES